MHIGGPAGDVAAVVADALQLRDDLEAGGDEAQIARGWGPQGEQVHAEAVQLQLPLVQAPVQGHDLVGLGLGALGERLDGEVDHLLG